MILGRMVKMGKEAGVPVPCFEKAYEKAALLTRGHAPLSGVHSEHELH